MSDRELACAECGARFLASDKELLRRLRGIGMLRREADPDSAVLATLAETALPRLTCDVCDAVGMRWEMVEGEWPEAVCCDGCDAVLDPERLELFPDARRCATCQRKNETGEDQESVYCPRCGDRMRTQARTRGVTRYELHCPSCGAKA